MFVNLPSPAELNRIVEKAQREGAQAAQAALHEEMLHIKDAHLDASRTVAAQVTRRALDRLIAQMHERSSP